MIVYLIIDKKEFDSIRGYYKKNELLLIDKSIVITTIDDVKFLIGNVERITSFNDNVFDMRLVINRNLKIPIIANWISIIK